MKNFTLCLFLTSVQFVFAQININNTVNAETLVKSILFKNACAITSNHNFSSSENVAKFNYTGNNFPFNEGVILRSGKVMYSEGNYQNNLQLLNSTVNSNSDNYLSYLSSINGQNTTITDVAFLEFDFKSSSQNFNFDFIFASNEYGEFQCSFSDLFAFVLTDLETNQSINLAVIPNTNTSVSVTNIKDGAYNSTCPSLNNSYFGSYNVNNPLASPFNFRGQTKKMNASASIIPNRNYKLRIVIGDYYDSSYDSAVIISAGSFETNLDLGPDFSICQGDEINISTNLTDANYQFVWKKNNVILPNTSNNLTILEPGTYKVIVSNVNTNCIIEDEITVTPLTYNNPSNIYTCFSSATTNIFNLNVNNTTTMCLNPDIYEVHYYKNNLYIPIASYSNYLGNLQDQLTIKIFNKITQKYCDASSNVQLLYLEEISIAPIDSIKICENVSTYNLNSIDVLILNGYNPANYTLKYFNNQIDAVNNQNPITNLINFAVNANITIWSRLQLNSNYNCFDVAPICIEKINLPAVDTLSNVTICGQYTLPTLQSGFYYTQPNGTGNQLNQGAIINNTATIYIYNQNQYCSNQSSFTITIINNQNHFSNVNACNSYTLPQVPYGNVYTGPLGTGELVNPGTTFTSNQTLHHYHVVNGQVCSNYSFQINVTVMPTFDNFDNIVIYCSSYTLPSLEFGSYYTLPNGQGTQLFAGDVLTTSQVVYIFYQLNNCIIQTSFNLIIHENLTQRISACGKVIVPSSNIGSYYTQPNGAGSLVPSGTVFYENTTIYLNVDWDSDLCNGSILTLMEVFPLPEVTSLSNVVTCETGYVLPTLTHGNYFSAPNGGGNQINPGTLISTNKTIYIYAANDKCSNQSSFTIKILDLNFQDVNACLQYQIQETPIGKFYTSPNGVGEIPTGTLITNSQTIYFYASQVTTTPNCTNNVPIQITIHQTPQVDTIQDIYTCTGYILPNLTNGSYYNNSNGVGETIPAGTLINQNKTIYIFNSNGYCKNQSSFKVNIINTIQFQNIQKCGSYTLPNLVYGAFFTEPNGGGIELQDNQTITNSQTIYYFVNVNYGTNCTSNLSFFVNILPLPEITIINNVLACENYTLTSIQNGNYFTQPNGQGTQLFPGNIITNNTTIYIFNDNGTCSNQSNFTVTLFNKPIVENFTDVNVCFSYTLPQIVNGEYYTNPGGTGQNLPAGTVINQNKTIYIFNANTNVNNCYSESQFNISILGVEAPQLSNVNVCDSYQLQQLTVGKYYTQPNKGGVELQPGTIIYNSQTIYIHVSNNNRILCEDEKSFQITISKTPILPNFPDVFGCGTYTLQPLTVGNYYTEPNGQGNMLPFNTVLTSSQKVYVYAFASTNANCKTQQSFQVTIYPLRTFNINNATICIDPITNLPISYTTLNSGIDITKFKVEWFLNNQLVHQGKTYTTNQAGTYKVVTTKLTPENPNDCNYAPTEVTVETSSKAIAEVEISEDFQDNTFIKVLIIKGNGNYMYQLDNNDFQESNIFTNVTTGYHKITIIDTKGSCGEVVLETFIINYPKFFTPNQDGYNDTWNITDLYDYKKSTIKIFDRYGKFIKEIFPNKAGWDGTYNNQEMPSTDYWFVVNYTINNVNKEYKAHFSLKR